jgi:uncharacterized repeat protein (TIGR01451 family)
LFVSVNRIGAKRLAGLLLLAQSVLLSTTQISNAGTFSINWDVLAYPAGVANPPAFSLTDQYGFQIDMRLQHTNANAFSSPLEDTTQLGTVTDIFLGSDAPAGSGGLGEAPATGVMEFFRPGTTTPVPVNGLSFQVTDIDNVDSNLGNGAGNTDRCDFVTLTGDAGNPTLGYLNGAPTGNGTNSVFRIGPSTGAGFRTVFTATPPGAPAGNATSNLTWGANQAHCLFYFNTGYTSPTSDATTSGSLLATYPNGTSRATVVYDEISENVRNSNTGDASARGIGLWGAGSFTVNNTISLDKQTTAVDFLNAGDVIPYTYVVTNNGPLPISSTQNIQIQDSKIGTFTCPAIPAAGVAPGATFTCTANYTVTAADVTANQVTNTATAGVGTGTQTFAARLQSNNDTVTVPRRTRLTLTKTVINDNGGTAVSGSFTLQAAGPVTISGASGSTAVTAATMQPGSYTLSETGPAGYAALPWSCTGGTLSGSVLTLTTGANASCSITNNDIQPILTLAKTVTDAPGAPSTANLFTLSAAGPTPFSGVTGTAAVTTRGVNAGVYTLSETGPSGYLAGAWVCPGATLSGGTLTLTPGQNITCTINNTKLPTVRIDKISNGATGSFAFSGNNGIPNQSIATVSPATAASGTVTVLTSPSTVTNISETIPAGSAWQLLSATCTGMGTGGTALLSGTTLTLDANATTPGSNIVCTFTNSRRPTISVQKVTNGNFGGPFTITVTNVNTSPGTITTTATGTATPAVPVKHVVTSTSSNVQVSESFSTAWLAAGVTCTDLNYVASGNPQIVATSSTGAIEVAIPRLRVGADINCVFTNTAANPRLTLLKTASPSGPVTAGTTVTYTFRVTNSGNTPMSNVVINELSFTGLGTHPTPSNETLLTDAGTPGDSNTGTANDGVWATLGPGDVITFTGTYLVTQADIDNQ